MLIRSRYLTLLCFFGPIRRMQELIAVWEKDGDESEVTSGAVERGGGSRQPTPAEYRALMMSFNGFDGDRKHEQAFFNEAAESLWSSHMFGDDPEADWRIESAFRYSYLSQASPDLVDRAGVRLHQERLERVLGRLALVPEPEPDKGEADASHELLNVLFELHRGWLFGNRPPAALGRAWELAEEAYDDRRGSEVPWEALILISLPMEGLELMRRWSPLVTLAWRDGHLDLSLLIQATCLRIQGGGVPRLNRKSPHASYETSLAWLVSRLVERTFCETETSPLRQEAGELIEPIGDWLLQTCEQQAIPYLRGALCKLRTLDPLRVRPVVRKWVERGDTRDLDLAHLDPPQADLLLDVNQIRILLARAQSNSGHEFSGDVLSWLASWSEEGSLQQLLPALARQISEALRPPGRKYGNFKWIRFAAQVREKPRLLAEVEKVLADDLAAPTLFAFVKRALCTLSAPEIEHWRMKDSFLGRLASFAADFDAELAAFLAPWFDPQKVTESGRDEVARLLAALLAGAPPAIHDEHREVWLAALRGLIGRGATGRGTLGSQADALGVPAVQGLQDNLIALVERPRRRRKGTEVSYIAQTIADARPLALPDLEEKLLECIASDDPDLALAALEHALELMADREFRERNQARLRRVCLAVRRLGTFRATSRFAELLESALRPQAEAGLGTGAAPVALPAGSTPAAQRAPSVLAQPPKPAGGRGESNGRSHRKGKRR